mmetsp:Transcript_2461/g.7639  ORF Transcript_2461/g.7639 Transcript_2461/m.7639 type:complete len:468 (+) Transcript_2461:215-1618(+)
MGAYEVPWYLVQAHEAASAWHGERESEEVMAELFEELAAREPNVGRVGELAGLCLAMPWNRHLAATFAAHGLEASGFPRGVDCGALLRSLSEVGVGANSMPFPLPAIEPGRVENNQTVVANEASHVLPILATATGVGYAFVRVLQRCIYGHVRHGIEVERQPDGRWRASGSQVAIKCIERRNYDQHLAHHQGLLNEDPIKEVAVMQHICRAGGIENVLGIVGCYAEDAAVYVVMPYCGQGDLFKFVEENRGLAEARAFAYFRQIIEAVHKLHLLGLVHHDMSLENILLDDAKNAVVIDFGMVVKVAASPRCFLDPPRGADYGTRELRDGTATPTPPLNYFAVPLKYASRWPARCGKLLYIAPELYATPRRPFDAFALDVWACGVILFLLLTGAPPWDPAVGPRDTDVRFVYVRDGRLRDLLDAWGISLPNLAVDLLMRLLDANPRTRITIPEIFQHNWWRQMLRPAH